MEYHEEHLLAKEMAAGWYPALPPRCLTEVIKTSWKFTEQGGVHSAVERAAAEDVTLRR